RRAAGLLVAGWLLACGGEPSGSLDALDPSAEPEPDDPAAAVEACRADAESFVLRVLPQLHGRHPLGSAEVRLLAGMVDQLEARDRDGRRMLARRLADGDDYRRRWGSELLD